jgi:Uma2 family endonuclease
MSLTARRMTSAEFLAQGETGPPFTQLIGGEVVSEMSDATLGHNLVRDELVGRLREWTKSEVGRGLAGSGGNWHLEEGTVVVPDAWWVADGSSFDRRSAVLAGGPDLAVEIRSPGTWRYDVGPKRAAYGRAGTAELWLVDWEAELVTVCRRGRPDSNQLDVELVLGPDDTLATLLLEGLALPLGGVLRP